MTFKKGQTVYLMTNQGVITQGVIEQYLTKGPGDRWGVVFDPEKEVVEYYAINWSGGGEAFHVSKLRASKEEFGNAQFDPSSLQKSLLNLINGYRDEQQQPGLAEDSVLTKAAQTYAEYIANNCGARDAVGHKADGKTHVQRIKEAAKALGKSYEFGNEYGDKAGEILAYGQNTDQDALQAWKLSDHGHNENMLNPEWQYAGVGVAPYKGEETFFIWCVNFGTKV